MIEEVKRGKREACDRLVERYLPLVLGYLQSLGASPTLKEDLSQEAFLRAFLHIHEYQTVKPFPAWLITIARNAFTDEMRKAVREKRRDRDLEAEPRASSPNPEKEVLANLGFAEKMAQLSVKSKLLLEMRIILKMAFSEIAESTGESEGALRVRFHRILSQLREHIERGDMG